MNTIELELAAKQLAGNWKKFPCFAWHRASELDDADRWTTYYTSGRDAGLLAQSNHAEITKRLALFMSGDDPDVVAERHSHWAVGYLDGFAVRVYRPDGRITAAFEELHRIREDLDGCPILNEPDYSDREYQDSLWKITATSLAGSTETYSKAGKPTCIPISATGARIDSSKTAMTKAVGHRMKSSSRPCKTWGYYPRL